MTAKPRTLTLILLCLLLPALRAAPALVVLVRHAEKEAAPANDPPLTRAGRQRAAELAKRVKVLAARYPLRAIFTTNSVRTRQTAAPLAAATHVAPTVTDDDPFSAVLAIHDGMVVIVGHSNTIPEVDSGTRWAGRHRNRRW